MLLSPFSTFRSGSIKWQANQCFRSTLKNTTCISLGPLGFHLSINFIKFSHKPVYPTMVVKHIQDCGVLISRKCICKSKKTEDRPFYYSRSIFLWFLLSPSRQRQIIYSLQLRVWTNKTYFKIYCFKSTLTPTTLNFFSTFLIYSVFLSGFQ